MAPFFVEYMGGRLEIQRNVSVFEDERTRVSQHSIAAFVKYGRTTDVTGDLAWHIMCARPFRGAEEVQAVVDIFGHANGGLRMSGRGHGRHIFKKLCDAEDIPWER